MKRICIVTASPLTLRAFMRNHLMGLSTRYQVSAVANFTTDDLASDWLPNVQLIPVPIARTIKPLADISAFMALFRHFFTGNFDVVHSVTPKAGLLAMSAARLANVPHRIHCFTGQVWATRQGFKRSLLKGADWLIAANSNHILIDSQSQRSFLENENIVEEGIADVLGEGSISGVDLQRFHPDDAMRTKIRDELGVPQHACLLLFVGRLNRDKGILDLATAFARLAIGKNDVWLAVVGPDEAGIGVQFEQLCGAAIGHVRRIDVTPTPEHYMAAADVFVLPSYREGFGSVVIEAAACGIPTVASRIYGLTDAVVEGSTGLLHPPGDIEALQDHLEHLCRNQALREEMGDSARARAIANFSMESVTADLLDYYGRILEPGNLA